MADTSALDAKGLSIDEIQWINGNGNPNWEPAPARKAQLNAMGYYGYNQKNTAPDPNKQYYVNGQPLNQDQYGNYYTTGVNGSGDVYYGKTLPSNATTQAPAAAPTPAPAPTPTPPPTPSTTPAPVPAANDALPPELQGLYDQLEQYLEELKKRGQVLNPNIEITPEKLAEFLSQAETEINPYFAGQLKLAKDTLINTLQYSKNALLQNEAQTARLYDRNLRGLGETAAEQGFAQSGLRKRDEGVLAQETNDAIQQAREAFSFNAGNAARGFAQQYGSAELPSLNLGQTPTFNAGQYGFQKTGRNLPLYELDPSVYDGLIGSQEFARRGAVQSRASELESAYRTQQALDQQRQLIL